METQKNKAMHSCELMDRRYLFTRVMVVLSSMLLAPQL
jgi:hypothetical protein